MGRQIWLHKGVEDVDLHPLNKYLDWSPGYQKFVEKEPGIEPFKLIHFMARQLPDNSKIVDIGTFAGSNAMAAAYNNDRVKVVAYDTKCIFPAKEKNIPTMLDFKNIEFKYAFAVDRVDELVDAAMIILDIDPHDGYQEDLFIERLTEKGYKGLVVVDDMKLNLNMTDFWESVQQKKLDASAYGHWSGTGIIVFDPETIDVIMDPRDMPKQLSSEQKS